MSKKDRETYQIKQEARQFFDPEHANLKLTMMGWGQMGIGITSQALEKVETPKIFEVYYGCISDSCTESFSDSEVHQISFIVKKDGVLGVGSVCFKNKLAQIMEKAINEAHEKGEP